MVCVIKRKKEVEEKKKAAVLAGKNKNMMELISALQFLKLHEIPQGKIMYFSV